MSREEELLKYLEENKPKGLNEILKALKWGTKTKSKIKEFLEELEKDGKILKLKGERYTLPKKAGYYVGEFDMVRRGFGFVDTDDGSIYVAREDFSNAMSGDKVVVRVFRDDGEGKKKEGKIINVLKRSKNKVSGIYEASQNFGFVKPRENFGKDIYVAYKNSMNARTGEMVIVEILFWGDEERKPEGKIIEVLGDAYDSNVMITALIKREGYSEEFSKEADAETILINEPSEKDLVNRKDLTNYPIITIDGEDARDLDDAVYVEKLKNDNYKVIVSIADVSHYVKEDSALDKEALSRGNSVYLVDRVIPMFPKKLSNGICSLNQGVKRLSFTVEMELDKTGKVLNHEIYKSVINVKHRMTYTKVNEILEDKCIDIDKYEDIKDMLFLMKEAAQYVRKNRFGRGSIDFDLSEIKVILDEKGKVSYIKKRERGEAEKIIEDFMILANETVAEKIFWMDIPFVYRIHEKPNLEKIKELNDFLSGFGYRIHNIDEMHPGKIQKIVEDIKDKDYKMVLNKMILMSLKQAKYTIENLGHFGLASNYYTHFTSPIRRYSDLLVHRVLSEIIERYPTPKRIKKMEKILEEATAHISKTERKAMKAEEESVKIKTTEYMLDKIGNEYDAVITGITPNNIYLELENYVEALIDNYGSENYFFDKKKYKILEKKSNKEYNIGDRLKVMVSRVNMDNLIVEVIPVKGDEK